MKTGILPPYTDRLSPERQEVFKKLKSFYPPFILGGGTAIMLQIGHRLSYDLDCFTEKKFPQNLLRKVRLVFGSLLIPELDTSEMLFIKTVTGVELNFVWHPYPTLRKPLLTPSLPLYHLDDLAANKAYTVGRRGAWRDYVDLFFFLKWKLYTIDKIIELTLKKFAGEFNEKLLLQQMIYFDDLDILPTVFLKETYTPAEIKSFLERQVEEYLRKILP